jgi:heme exporter protein A
VADRGADAGARGEAAGARALGTEALVAQLPLRRLGLPEPLQTHPGEHRRRLGGLDLGVLDHLHAIPPWVAEVQSVPTLDLDARLVERLADLGAVIDHQSEMAVPVGCAWLAVREGEELIAHVEEGHAWHASAKLEIEDAAVELDRLVHVADDQRDVVYADHPRHTAKHRLPPVAAIELERLERRYGERVALAGVSVRVEEGQTLAVLGGNGAGKTTLLRVLAGLLRPNGGRARVLGADLPGERWKLPAQVGYLGHEPLLYRELSGRENLRYHARLHRLAPARVEELLAEVGMEARADDPVSELSKGLVQRLAVARAVLHAPALLLLDEPRANLDPAAVELLEPLIGRASGRTRVLVSHDVEGALAESDLSLGLRGGRPAPVGAELYR